MKAKFYQVLITNEYTSTLNMLYTDVYNYASLSEALKTLKMYEDKAQDGIMYTNFTGEETVQYHLYYNVKDTAVIELKHEFFGYPKDNKIKQVIKMKSIFIKEIKL